MSDNDFSAKNISFLHFGPEGTLPKKLQSYGLWQTVEILGESMDFNLRRLQFVPIGR